LDVVDKSDLCALLIFSGKFSLKVDKVKKSEETNTNMFSLPLRKRKTWISPVVSIKSKVYLKIVKTENTPDLFTLLFSTLYVPLSRHVITEADKDMHLNFALHVLDQ
jgi:hypothetical protein